MTETEPVAMPPRDARRWWRAFMWITVSITVFGGAVVFVGTWGYSHEWGSTQWGPAAAWFSGSLTAAAVSISLWQTMQARKEADAARASARDQLLIAEKRHTEQLAKSDDLLARELDAQRRMEQIRIIPTIWGAMGQLSIPITDFRIALAVAAAKRGLEYESANDLENRYDVRTSAYKVLEVLLIIQNAFDSALILISEPNTQSAVSSLYADFQEVTDTYNEMIEEIKRDKTPDGDELDRMVKALFTHQPSMFKTVRENLTLIPLVDEA